MKAELILGGIGDLATVARGPVPRVGDCAADLARIDGAALAIDGGRFVFVGTARRARREVTLRSGGRALDLGGAAVVPGFVDAHTHLLFAGDRADELADRVHGATYRELARRGGGIYSTVRRTRHASDARLLSEAGARLGRMALNGTTTVEVKSGYALDHGGELRLLLLVPRLARRSGMRLVPTYLGAHAYPPGPPGSRPRYVRSILERTLPAVARARLAKFCDVFCEPGFFDLATSERILRRAASLGLGLKIHAEEFVRSGGAALATRLRVRSAEHLLEASPRDRAGLARAKVIAVLLPLTPLTSTQGARSPGREMVDARVPVALGSDLSPNSWVESMPLVIAHAVYSARLTPSESIVAATVNAAYAIGVADTAGTISVGRSADLAAFDLDSVEKIPYRIGAVPSHVYRRGIRISPS
ncbi:MAG: imidazolonepropionase [Thermoplasmata archaeon]|nr:imidazolonepropionase [Thermoplasmata archaeon]MCI4359553.1 imidazolonepropionase [Thermoplasmata archaeon]